MYTYQQTYRDWIYFEVFNHYLSRFLLVKCFTSKVIVFHYFKLEHERSRST